ncbi:TNFAIP3-interacting protein 3-like [Xiphias gladius]|uniref:TNFAIP3-interacting protein 3-like n=1 Tax=Xiphias gladius TaxID=8245 RepID=UPI001A987C83|nr:TNFAIP3-interacting protein 3-like [Xiphias gladius]
MTGNLSARIGLMVANCRHHQPDASWNKLLAKVTLHKPRGLENGLGFGAGVIKPTVRNGCDMDTASPMPLSACRLPPGFPQPPRGDAAHGSRAGGPAAADNKPTRRLYPSLPHVDSYDIRVVPDGSTVRGKPRTAADLSPERLPGDTQSEAPAAVGDVRMRAQILALEEQREELIAINETWAKEYRAMAHYYREQVRGLKALLQREHGGPGEGACEQGGKPTAQCTKLRFKAAKDVAGERTRDAEASSELLGAEKEARELRAQNSALAQRGRHQREEIRRLNKALEEALLTSRPLGPSRETLQDLWKHQAEVYKDDFLTERKDRETLKQKYLELENQFRRVRRELHVLKSKLPRTRPPQPVPECGCASRGHLSKVGGPTG